MTGSGADAAMAMTPADTVAAMSAASASVRAGARDLRLDLFRGLALWFIFLDHISDNVVGWLTMRNYGFSDATEVFVFISGYTAVVAYSGIVARQGWLRAAARVVRRVWQLYVAHIMLLVAFTAQIAWFALTHDRKSLIAEMNLLGLMEEPFRAFVDAVLLKFRPVNLDVLPLYIVLLASFAATLWSVVRFPWAVLAGSMACYVAARAFDWNLPASPGESVWFFNPFAWQLLFYLGAAFAAFGGIGGLLSPARRLLLPLSIAWLLFALFLVVGWHFQPLSRLVPAWVGRIVYPIDKTNLDVLRLLHFLALAYVVQLFVPMGAAWLRWRVAEPLRRCGEHSLQVFCLGTFLSFTAQVATERYEQAAWAQVVASVAGILTMVAFAYVAHWYKRGEASTGRSRGLATGAMDG